MITKTRKVTAAILIFLGAAFIISAIVFFALIFKIEGNDIFIGLTFLAINLAIPTLVPGIILAKIVDKSEFMKNGIRTTAKVAEYSINYLRDGNLYYVRLIYTGQSGYAHDESFRISSREYQIYPVGTIVECYVLGERCMIDGLKEVKVPKDSYDE